MKRARSNVRTSSVDFGHRSGWQDMRRMAYPVFSRLIHYERNGSDFSIRSPHMDDLQKHSASLVLEVLGAVFARAAANTRYA
jgi:hypothetical protein